MSSNPCLSALPTFEYLALLTRRSDGDFETLALFYAERLDLALAALKAVQAVEEVSLMFLMDIDCPAVVVDCPEVIEGSNHIISLLEARAERQAV